MHRPASFDALVDILVADAADLNDATTYRRLDEEQP